MNTFGDFNVELAIGQPCWDNVTNRFSQEGFFLRKDSICVNRDLEIDHRIKFP